MSDKNQVSKFSGVTSFLLILTSFIVATIILIIVIGLVGFRFGIGEGIDLKGNYIYSETQDIWGPSSELPKYFTVAKMVCEMSGKKCVVVMEIDYEIYLEELRELFLACGVNIDLVDPDEITAEQGACVRQQYQNMDVFGNVI